MTLGIMGAMTEEVQKLVEALDGEKKTYEIGQRVYHTGMLWGVPVVLVFARWGKVAAATSATALITRFGVDEIIFTGVAGAVAPQLGLGDVVIGAQLYQHDMDARPFFAQHEIPLLGATAFSTCDERSASLLRATSGFFDRDLPAIQKTAASHGLELKRPKVIHGDIASGDRFFATKDAISDLRSRLPSVYCVEMEGAAVAQVCHEYQIPFAIVRTISDSADEAAPVDFSSFVNHVASSYSHGILRQLLEQRQSA